MRLIQTILIIAIAAQLSSQCNSCEELNLNGDFEIRNNILGNDNASGLSQGEIQNWTSSHGTADFFDESWNWYYLENTFDSNLGHVCYGSRPTHDHSEGILTEVEILNDEDLTYCLNFDYSSYCDSDKFGKAHVYMSNNVSTGSVNGFKFPTKETHSTWFDNAQKIDELTLDEETDVRETGMTSYSTTFKPSEKFTQLWFFTEYLYENEGFVNCGFMLDNVKLTCETDALQGIEKIDLGNNKYEFVPVFSKELKGVVYEWNLGSGEKNSGSSLEHEFTPGQHEVCLKITDERGACAEYCLKVNIDGSSTNQYCDYSVCLSGGGIPSITKMEVLLPNGKKEILDNKSVGFGFPYCIGSWNMCNGGEYELEYLIEDLNFWFQKNNFTAQAKIGTNENVDEFCRGNILTIVDSELQFLQIFLGDERDNLVDHTNTFEIDNCEDIEESNPVNEPIVEVTAYPNPTANFVTVDLGDQVQEAYMELRDQSGTRIDQMHKLSTENQSNFQFDLSDQNTGIYYINVTTEFETKSIKVIKI